MSDRFEGVTVHCHPSRAAAWKSQICHHVGTCRECGCPASGEMVAGKDGQMFKCMADDCRAEYPWPQWPRLHVDAGVSEDYTTKEVPDEG